MGRMKEFAVWLAKCVHQRKMNDEQIILAAETTWGIKNREWLKEQIAVANASDEYEKLSKQS